MQFTAVLVYFLAACAGAVDPQRRDDASTSSVAGASQSGWNVASLSSALAQLSSNTTASANFGNISPPPKSLIGEILSAVPVTVLWELVDQSSRSSLASDFSAGSTPTWYGSLPSNVKSYMSVVRSQISGGALTATTGLAYQTTSGAGATATAATVTATATGSTSTSTGLAAAQPTGLTASLIGALSVLGLALAL
ncbi:uncharacterized protein N7459_000181 [Penicillium hispanicum]|uniref:uncharacterized protein n=1 Tax=Penicillium hispanicum TaxID=1080232 RepID=UPI0025423A8D|nr:uncharacterized protein N7459_000181 [Penicillium hispanicum]KAJ5593973.1 hypothetical protein N7459_000181 [Penicillium hispanicum]